MHDLSPLWPEHLNCNRIEQAWIEWHLMKPNIHPLEDGALGRQDEPLAVAQVLQELFELPGTVNDPWVKEQVKQAGLCLVTGALGGGLTSAVIFGRD